MALPPSNRLTTMSPKARRAFAIKCALAGFAASGRGFNGETYDREKHPSVTTMLTTHFERLYDEGKL